MVKKIFVLFFLCALFSSCVTNNTVRVTQKVIAGDTTTEKIDRNFKLDILFTNDVHGHVNREGKISGTTDMITFAGFVETMRENNEYLLLLDAGDFISGTLFADSYRGTSMEELAGIIGYNAMAIGNQDFNFGYKVLVANMEDARKRGNYYVSQNVKNGGRNVTDRYKIFNFDGFKIGVIGLTTPETKFRAYPDNVSNLTFDIDIKDLQRDINSLHRVVDYVILLSHVGQYVEEEKFVSIKTIMNQINGVDLVIDGHSHTIVKEAETVNNALLVQAGSYLNSVGLVEILVEEGEVIASEYSLIPASELEDPKYSETLKKYGIISKPYSDRVAEFIEQKEGHIEANFADLGTLDIKSEVSYLPQELTGDKLEMQSSQTDLGYVVAEAYTLATEADFAIVNSGSLRFGLPLGRVTVEDLYAFSPYDYNVLRISMTGKQVWDVLQYAVSSLPSADSKYPQTDLHLEVEPNLPVGSKVVGVYFRDGKTPVVNSSDVLYNVAINEYMLNGGDGFEFPRTGIYRAGRIKDVVFNHFVEVYPPNV